MGASGLVCCQHLRLGHVEVWEGQDCGLVVRSGALDSGAWAAAVAVAASKVAAGRALQIGAAALLWMQPWRPAKRRPVSGGGQAVLSR